MSGNQYGGERRRREDSWHLSKTISLSQIMTIVAMVVSGLWYAVLIDKRVSIIESKAYVPIEQVTGLETRVALLEQYSQMTASSLERIERKLDKLTDAR